MLQIASQSERHETDGSASNLGRVFSDPGFGVSAGIWPSGVQPSVD